MYSLLSDREIKELCTGDRPMLSPFVATQVRENLHRREISSGLSSYGYDLRLSPHDFRIFKNRNFWQRLGLQNTPIVDPKNFDESLLYKPKLHSDRCGQYFVITPHSSALGVAIEKIDMPDNIIAIAVGKTTYARSGVSPFITSAKSGWKGYLMLEFTNNTDFPCKKYVNEGVCELTFWRGENPVSTYGGVYQNQANTIITARV